MQDDVVIGTTREEDLLGEEPVAVTQEHFDRWMQEAESQEEAGDIGSSMGRRLSGLLALQQEHTETQDRWSILRALAADLQEQRFLRAAGSLQENVIAAVLHAHGALRLDAPPQIDGASLAAYVADAPHS